MAKKTKGKSDLKQNKGEEKIIKETIAKLLNILGVEGDFNFTQTEELIDVVLETKDSGVVIGYHGETLEALQLIASLSVSKKIGRFTRVSVEVGDYKKNRIGWLENLALQAKEQALSENREVPLPSLKSWERRIVHMFLQNDDSVVSESVGEGRSRTLIIKPR